MIITNYRGVEIIEEFVDRGNGDTGMFMYRSEEIDGYWYKDIDILKRKIDLKVKNDLIF